MVCWLALGAVVNVVVTWALVLTLPLKMGTFTTVNSKTWPVPALAGADWPAAGGDGMFVESFGQSTEYCGAMTQNSVFTMEVNAFGWPFKSLRRVRTGVTRLDRSFMPSIEYESLPAVRALTRLIKREERLPVRPLWPGFAVNTLLCASALALMWLVPAAILRQPRAKWIGLGLVATIVVVGLASPWLNLDARDKWGHGVQIWNGALSVPCGRTAARAETCCSLTLTALPLQPSLWWWFQLPDGSPYAYLRVPLWVIALLAAVPTAGLWWRHLCRGGPCDCPTCGYDLTGLAPGKCCPECGKTSAITNAGPGVENA